MHIFFSGIGGAGIGPLALVAQQAGFTISGSDKQSSSYVHNLEKRGIRVIIGQDGDTLKQVHEKMPIDWFVYSSALPKENPNHPELVSAQQLGLKMSKRDEFLNYLLKAKNLKMFAIAGTHGKTTTTSMAIWLMKELGIPISYSVGAKLNFGDMGEFDEKSEYFIYEADEYDRNFLSFDPKIAIISGVAYDHPDTYPTEQEYREAFTTFIRGVLEGDGKVYIFDEDLEKIYAPDSTESIDEKLTATSQLLGSVNRKDALLVAYAVASITGQDVVELYKKMDSFPGVSRRFEKITENVYTDYAHTPEKIEGALQLAHEVAKDRVVVVYEGLHNTRQHFIKDKLPTLFAGVQELYIVPSYLAREDTSLELLTPEKLRLLIIEPLDVHATTLGSLLKEQIEKHRTNGQLVLCFSAGGAGSLDEWLRLNFQASQPNSL
ncbi:MAG TPA: Mur ligase domain-containing protein [Candidatus Saccharibacteria bacterium]|jgi:UDP-N-acetylmuramate--alanine ligase|nr:Mur ligase domain-containing protein [Candidatus Saccharibacteria bacterium]